MSAAASSDSSSHDPPRDAFPREADEDLGLAALEAVQARIRTHIADTQGAWTAQPLWRRTWPVALATAAALGWAGRGLSIGVTASALVVLLAGVVAAVAVVIAARQPRRGELMALAALGVAAGALIFEVARAAFAEPVPGSDIRCAAAITLGALLPVVFFGLYLRLARTPARLFHVAAVAAASLCCSMASVWAECPATALGHALRAHAVAPVLVGLVALVALRPWLRGPRLG